MTRGGHGGAGAVVMGFGPRREVERGGGIPGLFFIVDEGILRGRHCGDWRGGVMVRGGSEGQVELEAAPR